MYEEIYSDERIKPLLNTGPTVPREAIENLARELAKDKRLAKACNKLFRFETSFTTAPDSYTTIWLAFSLALAQDKDAMIGLMDLFELVDPMEHDILWELAQFALWQYGDDAVRQVLEDFWRVLEIDHTGYFLGVLEVVGLSQDQLLRKRVANAVIDALQSPTTSAAALMGLVDIAIILEDKRLPVILERWKDQVSCEEERVLAEAEQMLLEAEPELRNDEYKMPWHDLAEFSADHFSIHFNEPAPGLMSPPDEETLNAEFNALAQSFRQSSYFPDIPARYRKDPQAICRQLIEMFQLMFESMGTLPDEADAEEVAALMRDVLPQQMVAQPKVFEAIPHILIAFFHFMTDDLSIDEGNEFETRIQESTEEMLRRAADPGYWNIRKRDGMRQM